MEESFQACAKHKLTQLLEQTCAYPPQETLKLVCSGASGRVIMRACGLIGVYWNKDRADNNSFLPVLKALQAAGIKVPRLVKEWSDDKGIGACLVKDLGTRDILSYKNAPWEQLKECYSQAFQSLIPLYHLKPDWQLQPAFDAELYRWEQAYFAEYFLMQHVKMPQPKQFIETSPFRELIDFLTQLPQVPIHRDCQSQNIMMHEGQAWLIDFQGMRMGRHEYDLASLIYDPYMDLSAEQRGELLTLWEQLSVSPIDENIFTACALQRIMQALGAFANIGYNQKRNWYLNQIPAGLRALKDICARPSSHALCSCLRNALNL